MNGSRITETINFFNRPKLHKLPAEYTKIVQPFSVCT